MKLTASDIARRTCGAIHPQTVRYAARRGELPFERTAGGIRLFESADVDRWLLARGVQLKRPTR
jgi:excisionase family DNA binding protein